MQIVLVECFDFVDFRAFCGFQRPSFPGWRDCSALHCLPQSRLGLGAPVAAVQFDKHGRIGQPHVRF
jgi:hypothetical protein